MHHWMMSDEDKSQAELDALAQRLKKARGKDKPIRHASPTSGLGIGFRLGTELVVAVGVGTAMGWFLDQWLGTQPWLLIVFFFFGVAAGFVNVMRSAAQIEEDRKEMERQRADTEDNS